MSSKLNYITSGLCDFCQLDCLKVSPLTCMRHFYCNTCLKHVDKLQKRDFACKLCERIQTERRRESRNIDSFITQAAAERRHQIAQDVQMALTGANVISFQDDDDLDQSDLTGYNDEWEQLISSLSYKPSCADASGVRDVRSPTRSPANGRSLVGRSSRASPDCREFRLSPYKDKCGEDSRIYDWCVAAEKSLSSSKSSGRFEKARIQTPASLSSSSENTMGMKKFLQQSRKKERPSWREDSESEDDECFSRMTNFDKGQPEVAVRRQVPMGNPARDTGLSESRKSSHITIPDGKNQDGCYRCERGLTPDRGNDASGEMAPPVLRNRTPGLAKNDNSPDFASIAGDSTNTDGMFDNTDNLCKNDMKCQTNGSLGTAEVDNSPMQMYLSLIQNCSSAKAANAYESIDAIKTSGKGAYTLDGQEIGPVSGTERYGTDIGKRRRSRKSKMVSDADTKSSKEGMDKENEGVVQNKANNINSVLETAKSELREIVKNGIEETSTKSPINCTKKAATICSQTGQTSKKGGVYERHSTETIYLKDRDTHDISAFSDKAIFTNRDICLTPMVDPENIHCRQTEFDVDKEHTRSEAEADDRSSYEDLSVEGPMSDSEYQAYGGINLGILPGSEESRWLNVQPSITPVDLHDSFWDQ